MITWRTMGGGSGVLPESRAEEDELLSSPLGRQWMRENGLLEWGAS